MGQKFYLTLQISLILCVLWNTQTGYAQSSEIKTGIKITASFPNVPFIQAVESLEAKYPIRFYFKAEWIDDLRVNVALDSVSASQAARLLLAQSSLSFYLVNERMIILSPESLQTASDDQSLFEVSGILKDGNSAAPIYPGTVYFRGSTERSASTNAQGFFNVSLPYGQYSVKALGQGSFERNFDVDVFRDTYLELELLEKTIELEDVIIRGTGIDDNITGTNSGRVTVNIETLSSMPAFLGEVDVSRAVITIPGVATVGEGATGFNVRGGNLDQNLILMDNIPLYNSSHLLGFFSVFNPDLIQSFTLHKGGIPARYGGRVSSVLEVRQQTSNKDVFKLKASAGFVTSKLFFDIPIVTEKSGLLLAGRGAYPGWIIGQIEDPTLRKSNANYYDINAKFDYVFNDKNLLEFSGYYSWDNFSFAEDTVFEYRTKAASVRFEHVLKNESTLEFSSSYSDFQASLHNDLIGQQSETTNGMLQVNSKLIYHHQSLLGHEIEAGVDLSYYQTRGATIVPGANSAVQLQQLSDEKALESAIFVSDNFTLLPQLSLMVGLRYSQFHIIGAGSYPIYDPNLPRSTLSIIETLNLSSGTFEKVSSGIEPRAAVNFTLNPHTAIKLGYNRTRQYVHLLSNTVASLPTDTWKLSGPSLEPLIGDQVTLGLFKNFKGNTYETSIEGFYKEIQNIIDFRDGTEILLNEQVLHQILQGKARSRGLEFSLVKNNGSVRGRIGYTYSLSEISFDSPFPQEQLNGGAFFAANFDRPHQLSIDNEFKLSRLWTLSSSFTLNSGRPVTLPGSSFSYGNVRVFSDITRNNYRIPDYHRLDLAVTLKGSNKKNKKFEHSWTLSVYNVYARKNPFSVYLNAPNGISPRVFQLSVLGTAFPSLTYNLRLK